MSLQRRSLLLTRDAHPRDRGQTADGPSEKSAHNHIYLQESFFLFVDYVLGFMALSISGVNLLYASLQLSKLYTWGFSLVIFYIYIYSDSASKYVPIQWQRVANNFHIGESVVRIRSI